MEDLAVANLVRNRYLARPIADAAWGELYRQFAYKATWYGSQLMSAPRWFPSSKTCSNCGSVHQNLDLSQRVFRCDTSDTRGGATGPAIPSGKKQEPPKPTA